MCCDSSDQRVHTVADHQLGIFPTYKSPRSYISEDYAPLLVYLQFPVIVNPEPTKQDFILVGGKRPLQRLLSLLVSQPTKLNQLPERSVVQIVDVAVCLPP